DPNTLKLNGAVSQSQVVPSSHRMAPPVKSAFGTKSMSSRITTSSSLPPSHPGSPGSHSKPWAKIMPGSPSTVNSNGVTTVGVTGSLLSTQSSASWMPGARPVASAVIVDTSVSPAAVLPAAVPMVSHGIDDGLSHASGSVPPPSVFTTMTMKVSAKSGPTAWIGVGDVTPHSGATMKPGCVCDVSVAPMYQTPPTTSTTRSD